MDQPPSDTSQQSTSDPLAKVTQADDATILVPLLEEVVAKLEAGDAVNRDALIAAHPQFRTQIDAILAGHPLMNRAAPAGEDAIRTLGDFRIVREIGRGGMGVVYEAEQVSLKRAVALKILRFAGTTDSEAATRFQREAETVASLHHTSIVPIFAIGCDQSIHFFAMQLISGRSLRDVAKDNPVPVTWEKTVAAWGLQAADALEHAHKRGVIHRDIKPSNLLLDNDGQIWLTDFGLAKRLDDATLSLGGILLGTPRYMSPEQASAGRDPIDHRTDIYSLGATLYELLTRRPLFAAESPQLVIAQILNEEPARPRNINPNLSRDIETIILKCLCKDPTNRYQTAQQLADDLRAFIEGRAIKAARESVFERAARWAIRHRRRVLQSLAMIVMSIMISIGTLMWWNFQVHARNGTLLVKSKAGPLTAELFHPDGKLAIPTFTVPNEQPVEAPEGEYRLRIKGNGELSQTSWLTVHRGQDQELNVDLAENFLIPPVPISTASRYEFLDFGEGPDLVMIPKDTSEKLQRVSGRTGKVLWSLEMNPESPGLASILPTNEIRTIWQKTARQWDRHRESFEDYQPIRALRPLLDLDDDGTLDLVWLLGTGESILAVSGETGKPLWWRTLTPDADSGRELGFNSADLARVHRSDGSILPVLAVTINSRRKLDVRSRMIVINAKDNSLLWETKLSDRAPSTVVLGAVQKRQAPDREAHGQFEVADTAIVASGTRLSAYDVASGKPLGQPLRLHDVQGATNPEADSTAAYSDLKPRLLDVDGDGQLEVMLVSDGMWILPPDGIRVVSLYQDGPKRERGRPNWFVPFSSQDRSSTEHVCVADLNGDGSIEMIVVNSRRGFECRVLDGVSGRELWSRSHLATGIGEINSITRILARFGAAAPFGDERHSGAIVGADINGDGWNELYTASLQFPRRPPLVDGTEGPNLFVDCFSGRDGKSLWISEVTIPDTAKLTDVRKTFLFPLSLSPVGSGGEPTLAVNVLLPDTRTLKNTTSVFTCSGINGRLLQVGDGLARAEYVDLDQDGLDELTVVSTRNRQQPADHSDWFMPGQGEIRIYRGDNPIGWRRFGNWEPAMDLDGDGQYDLWQTSRREAHDDLGRLGRSKARIEGFLPIISGRDGSRLADLASMFGKIKGKLPGNSPIGFDIPMSVTILSQPFVDADGDGHPESLICQMESYEQSMSRTFSKSQPLGLTLFSSKNRSPLWTAPEIGVPQWADSIRLYRWLGKIECRDLDHDQHPEFIVPFQWAGDDIGEPAICESAVAVLDSRSGNLKWIAKLREDKTFNHDPYGWGGADRVSVQFGDFDADGVVDLAVYQIEPSGSWEPRRFVQVRSGTDGHLLWPEFHPRSFSPSILQIAVADVDGTKGDELIRIDFEGRPASKDDPTFDGEFMLDVLNGRTGKIRFQHRWPGQLKQSPGVDPICNLLTLHRGARDAIIVRRVDSTTGQSEDLQLAIPDNLPNAQEGLGKLQVVETRHRNSADWNWSFDLANDGLDELVSWRQPSDPAQPPELVVSHNLHDEIWRRSMPRLEQVDRATIQLADANRTMTIGAGKQNIVLSSDGEILSRFVTSADADHDAFPDSEPWSEIWRAGNAPRVIERQQGQTKNGLILSRDQRGRAIPIKATIDPTVALRPDPRDIRPLPWVERGAIGGFNVRLLLMTMFLIVSFVIPFSLIRIGWRRRQETRALLVTCSCAAACWIGALVVVISLRNRLDQIQPTEFVRFVVIPQIQRRANVTISDPTALAFESLLAAWPLAFLPGLLIGWFRRRRFLAIALQVLVMALTSAIIAGTLIVLDRTQMHPSEIQSFAGWYQILFLTASLGAWLSLIVRVSVRWISFEWNYFKKKLFPKKPPPVVSV